MTDTTKRDPWWAYPIIGGLLLCPIVGVGMWLYTDNTSWLWLCIPIIIFLS